MPQAALLTLGSLQLAFMGLDTIGAILAVVLGFGVLVFVHELGHFLAARWVGVRVEVFSLGFGPRLFYFVRGVTEYRISALPLGGYVKMLGQDDADPNAPRTQAPDDFRNKSVGGRVLILIAGVVMNTIFALIAFIVAFAIGVEFTAPEIGVVNPNSAGSQARIVGSPEGTRVGLAAGDQILAINGSPVFAWEDVTTSIALANGPIRIDIARPDSSTGRLDKLTLEATPRKEPDEPFPKLNIEYQQVVSDEMPADSPAKLAGIQKDDQLLDVAPVGSALGVGRSLREMDEIIQANAGKPVQVLVLRRQFDADGRPFEKPPERKTFTVEPKGRPVYDIGIVWADVARIEFVQGNSPAKGFLEPDDMLVSIDGRPIGAKNLPEAVKAAGDAHRRGKGEKSAPVIVKFLRRSAAGVWEEKEGSVQLEPKPNDEGWFLGVRYLADKVESVLPGSPAEKAGIKPGYFVTGVATDKLLWVWPKNKQRGKDDQVKVVCFEKKDAPWTIYFETPDGKQKESKDIAAVSLGSVEGDLGIKLMPREIMLRRGIVDACVVGWDQTIRMFQRLVLTLRRLVTRDVSSKELGGPIQIASITYKIASSHGLGKLFYFLAILSVNLAVLNILPIPVLDGGHIFLLTVEKLKGRPLSDDVMRYVQYAGLLFVVGLMLYVTFNDIRRVFE